MRKFLFFALSAIFTAGTPAGCNTDYNAISYFVWVNDSDHKITLFVESDLGCEFKNEVILPGESFTAMDNGMGVCPVPSSYIWKMTIIFDDGRLGSLMVSVITRTTVGRTLRITTHITTLRSMIIMYSRI